MAINADKPHLWKGDIAASVDLFNDWFLRFAPDVFRKTRKKTTVQVEAALLATRDLRDIGASSLKNTPAVLPILRMSTAPPLARDRLVGLAGVNKSLVSRLEAGLLPTRMAVATLDEQLARISAIITRLLDEDVFPWLAGGAKPKSHERTRAATIVADRLCGAVSDPIVRNAQEQRQLALLERELTQRGYRRARDLAGRLFTDMQPGTFAFRLNIVVGTDRKVNIPVDVVIQPKRPQPGGFPILLEAKSAGDFTNTNKRRKEEATKIHQLRATYGPQVQLVLFLCGYFDSGYLGYSAAEGLDWIWEHRLADLDSLGL